MKRPKHVPSLADIICSAWEDHAPNATFAGMTLAQFKSTTQPSTDTRSDLVSITAQRRGKADARNQADAVSRDAIQRVVAAVRSDPNYGPDSPVLAAMSYVTRSARKTGKTNKTNGNGQATAAAVKSH
jgi:hypothetical protein